MRVINLRCDSMQRSTIVSDKEASSGCVKSIAIRLLKPSRYQVRDIAFFDKQAIENLAASIESVGLLESPKVRIPPEDPGYFEIISGHRRIHAVSQILGWKEIVCEIFENIDEFKAFQISLEENIERHNLSSYEEGLAFLLSENLFGLSQDQIAERFHQSRATVQSKRQLTLAAGSFLKYTESSYSKAFLRHITIGHITILNKLDPADLKIATKMISRGATTRHLARFGNLFGSVNSDNLGRMGTDYTKYSSDSTRNQSRVIKLSDTDPESEMLQRLDKLIDESRLLAKSRFEIKNIIREILAEKKQSTEQSKEVSGHPVYCQKCGTLVDVNGR